MVILKSRLNLIDLYILHVYCLLQSNGHQLFLNTICSNNNCRIPLWKNIKVISNELELNIRQAINMYYSNELKCKNPLCSNVTKKLPLHFYTMYPKCNKCNESFLCRKVSIY